MKKHFDLTQERRWILVSSWEVFLKRCRNNNRSRKQSADHVVSSLTCADAESELPRGRRRQRIVARLVLRPAFYNYTVIS